MVQNGILKDMDGGGSFNFTSQDQAFGYGAAQMGANGWYSSQNGWATSFSDALHNYSGGNGTITSGMVQGYFEQKYGASYMNIQAEYSSNGKGFNISMWNEEGTSGDNSVNIQYSSMDKMMGLFGVGENEESKNEFTDIFGNPMFTGHERGPKKSSSTIDKIIKGTGLGTDINTTTWTAMSKIPGAGKLLGKIAEKGTVAGIVVSVVSAGKNILSGNGTWRDAVTLGVAGISGIAMATGVGEVAAGIGAIAWDIWDTVTGD